MMGMEGMGGTGRGRWHLVIVKHSIMFYPKDHSCLFGAFREALGGRSVKICQKK